MPIFTIEELYEFDVSQLRQLGAYFGVELADEKIKEMMINKIYSKIEKEEDANLPLASVQVQRIRKSMKEK